MNKVVMMNDTIALSNDDFWELVEVLERGGAVSYLIQYDDRQSALKGLFNRMVSPSVPSRLVAASDCFRSLSLDRCIICGGLVSPESPDFGRAVHTGCEVNQ